MRKRHVQHHTHTPANAYKRDYTFSAEWEKSQANQMQLKRVCTVHRTRRDISTV